MWKKISLVVFLCVFLIPLNIANAFQNNDSKINIYFFRADGCPHCAAEKTFLHEIGDKYEQVNIVDLEVSNNSNNLDFLVEVGKKLNADISGVPLTVVGENYFIGWHDEFTTGTKIEEELKRVIENGCLDVGSEYFSNKSSGVGDEKKENNDTMAEIPKISVPFLGDIDIKNLSLPILTIILGALDGFNPCAMWTLVFLISLLLGMKDRKRMWILGVVFIFSSSAVYFMFMTAWLNLILFIGFVIWIRIIIGLVALFCGGYNLREFFMNPQLVCKVTSSDSRKKVFERLRMITMEKSFWLSLIGIVLLAFAVNLVELICSAGLPAVFTQILVLSDLPKWQYYLYFCLYILIFMLDDLFVFVAAMVTLQITGVTSKYARYSHFVGGLLMLILGFLLLFKPEWLMFS